ncbi:MAG: MarR family transcriptional regulator [Burkholderiaceae bacterium]|jgi:DNA-binding MarR family transcriptional regulator|nr:MarR family transcriptional regulator [Burkholderiaceae bacterium]
MTDLHRWRDPIVLDDMFLYHLARLQAAAGSRVVRLCEGGYGITRREWRMVCLLAETGPLQPSQLAAQAQLDRTRTSRAVTALLAKGLAWRESQAGDARRALLRLSDTGRALHAELFPQVQAINRELMDAVPEAELQAMASAFARIRERAKALEASSPPPKAPRNRKKPAAT